MGKVHLNKQFIITFVVLKNKSKRYGTPTDDLQHLKQEKEQFIPLHAPHVSTYVCGPTVYGDAHLGYARPAMRFDILFRYLTHLGYKIRYVRNITDVGHLDTDADEGKTR